VPLFACCIVSAPRWWIPPVKSGNMLYCIIRTNTFVTRWYGTVKGHISPCDIACAIFQPRRWIIEIRHIRCQINCLTSSIRYAVSAVFLDNFSPFCTHFFFFVYNFSPFCTYIVTFIIFSKGYLALFQIFCIRTDWIIWKLGFEPSCEIWKFRNYRIWLNFLSLQSHHQLL
jgi:hypothetical protein